MVLLVRGLLRVGPLTERMAIDSWVFCFLAVEGKGISTSVRSPFLNLGNYTHCKPYTAPMTVLQITRLELLVCTLQE
jgi:hypothetical protein